MYGPVGIRGYTPTVTSYIGSRPGVTHYDKDSCALTTWIALGPHDSLLRADEILACDGSHKKANPGKAQRQQIAPDSQL
jgi:hypothetical protein